jgi:hypothetical protein
MIGFPSPAAIEKAREIRDKGLTHHSFAYRGFVFAHLPDGWHFQRVLTRQVWGPFPTDVEAQREADRQHHAWVEEAQKAEGHFEELHDMEGPYGADPGIGHGMGRTKDTT